MTPVFRSYIPPMLVVLNAGIAITLYLHFGLTKNFVTPTILFLLFSRISLILFIRLADVYFSESSVTIGIGKKSFDLEFAPIKNLNAFGSIGLMVFHDRKKTSWFFFLFDFAKR